LVIFYQSYEETKLQNPPSTRSYRAQHRNICHFMVLYKRT